MSLTTTTHVNFDGDARAALEFWGAALGAAPQIATYGAMSATDEPGWADRVVFGQVETPTGARIMAFDVWPHQPFERGASSFYVFLTGDDVDEIRRCWEGLAEGAEIRQPLGPSGWSLLAGQLRDRFGVIWQLDVRAPQAA